MAKHQKSNEIADAIGAILTLVIFGWIAWMLFAKQIIAWLTNLLVSIVNTIIGVVAFLFVLGVGFYIAWWLVEADKIPSGWGILLTIAIFLILGYLQLTTISPILVLIDFGAMAAFVWKLIDQAQYNGISGGFLR